MESKQVLSILNEIENSVPVQSWNIEGIDIWPYVRFRLGSKLFERKLVEKGKRKFVERYLLGLFKYIPIFFKNILVAKMSPTCDYLFVENGTHVSKHSNSYYYIRTDPVRESLERKGKKCLTYVTGYKFDNPSFAPNIQIQYSMDIQYLLTKLFRSREGVAKIEGYDYFEKFLKDRNLYDEDFSERNIQKGVERILFYKDFFKRRLLKLKPKAVFILCYYSTYGYGLVRACKELKIPLIDIQHGIQGEYHYSYSGFEKVPKEGFNLLPDIFYVWGVEEENAICSWKNEGIQVFKGGNDYLNLWKESKNDFVKNTIQNIKKKYSLEKYSKIILFTVYPGIGHDKEIVKAIQNSPKDWFWFVRHHPKSDTRSESIQQRIGDVECGFVVDDIVSVPLFALIAVSDIHITERSSVVIECAEMGVQSIVTKEESKDLFKSQFDEKMVLFSNDTDDILRAILTSKRNIPKEWNKGSDIKKLIEIIDHIYAHHN